MERTLPIKPTVMPLNVRNPDALIENKPSTRPRVALGACICTSVCVMLENDSSQKPATNNARIANG